MPSKTDSKTCGTCASASSRGGEGGANAPSEEKAELARRMAAIPHKILVFSGKGGVGKSTVAANLAATLADRGHRVGLLDIDFHGPSIPMLFGLQGQKTGMRRGRIEPIQPSPNLRVMSLAFLIENPDDAVIWRGPMKMGVIEQLLRDVDWGDTEYLIIDSPPGTGDEPLSVCQLIPDATGGVVVTTPQQLSVSDVRRSIKFCSRLSLPVLGVIENMSGFVCPHCGELSNVFKEGGGEALAREAGVQFLGRLPMDSRVMEAGDSGIPFARADAGPATAAFQALVDKLTAPLSATAEAGAETAVNIEMEKAQKRFAVPLASGTLAEHFGHCEEFALVDADAEEGSVLRTSVAVPPAHEPGVLPRWLQEQGVQVILAGGMGTRAQQLFTEQGMTVVTGVPSDGPDALVEAYLGGRLVTGENVCSH